MAEFEKYLSEKLTILNVDCDTYLDYIQEILKDEDQSQDEILEMIQETLEASSVSFKFQVIAILFVIESNRNFILICNRVELSKSFIVNFFF